MEKPKPADNRVYKFFLGALAALLLCGLSFYGGIHYQKGRQTSSVSQAATAAGGFGGGGFGSRFAGARPTFGAVSTISSTSITVKSTTDGSSKTFSIDSSTQITNGGQSASVADIQAGDNVIIRTSSSSSTTASAILINPAFGSAAGNSTGSGTSTN